MFVAISASLVVIPWTIIYLNCLGIIDLYRRFWAENPEEFTRSYVLAVGWGVADVTAALCFAHIGVALTGAILTGVGVTFGVLTPLLLKSTGMGDFGDAPDLMSDTGIWILAGMAVMITSVVIVAVAGLGRVWFLVRICKDYIPCHYGTIHDIPNAFRKSAYIPFLNREFQSGIRRVSVRTCRQLQRPYFLHIK